MTQVIYVGNFLSKHGLNPTYAETLVPQLEGFGLSPLCVSHHLNPILRMTDILLTLVLSPRDGSCVILDLYSGPRAFQAAFLISLACRLVGKPYLLVLHGGGLPERLLRSRTRLLYMLEGAERVISPSWFLADSFSPFVHIRVIPNGLAVTEYPYRLRSSPRPRFLYLRAFHRFYDPKTAIRAFSRVHQIHPEAQLRMVGPDEDGTLAECQSLVNDLKLNSSVELSGQIPKSQIPQLGSRYDIFVNSSLVDNAPVSTIEAMALGMCIVSTNVGGMPYLLKDGQTALLVSPGSDEEMAEAMMRIIQDSALATRLSRDARSTVEFWDWSNIIPRWIELIQTVVGNAP